MARAAASHGRWKIVAVAHHQEANVPDGERVPLPRAVHGVRHPVGMHVRVLGCLPGRVYPLPRPPLQWGVLFDRRVVIAHHGVEVLPWMPGAHPKLADDLATLFVRRRGLPPRVVAEDDGDIPIERRSTLLTTLFRLPNRVGQAFPPKLKVRPNMRAAHRPESELFFHWQVFPLTLFVIAHQHVDRGVKRTGNTG